MTIVNRRTFTAKPGHMEELIDVLKAGGSYLFFHRLLQDYFADLPPDDDGSAAS